MDGMKENIAKTDSKAYKHPGEKYIKKMVNLM